MGRRVPLILAALLLALVGAVLVVTGGGRSGAEASSSGVEQSQVVPVLVATQFIGAGTSGQELADGQLVELRDMPVVAVPPGALADVVPLREFVASADIQPGEMLMQAKFVSRSMAGSVRIPEDKVAVSVQVDAPQRVGSFVRPGTEVAVFATYSIEAPAAGAPLPPGASEWPEGAGRPVVDAATRLMLPRAMVLAVDDTTVQGLAAEPAASEGAAASGEEAAFVITVAVSVEEAQKLAHAAQTSRLTLALLSEQSRTGTGSADDTRTLFG